MPEYGPPGGPPGHAQEPWSRHQPPAPDEQPTQEWRRPDSWDNAPPSYGQPEAGYPRYPQSRPEPRHDHPGRYAPPQPYGPGDGSAGAQAAWPRNTAAPSGPGGGGNSRNFVLVLVVVLALLVLGSGGTALYLFGGGGGLKTRERSAQPPAPSPSAARGTTAAPPTSTPTPIPQSSADARFVKVGQCVKNEGAENRPRLVVTRCTTKTYEVLARFDGATTGEKDAKAKCAKVSGYTDWYFFNSELDVLDFVLCLKLR